MFRAAFLVISAVSAGLALGRQALAREVDKRTHSAIQDAGKIARERIRAHTQLFFSETFRTFVIVTAVKILLLGSVWAAHAFGLISDLVFTALLITLLVLFVLRDILATWPVLRLMQVELRQHGWRPKRAVGEIVAAQVFSEVLEEAGDLERKWSEDVLLRLSGKKRDDVTRKIAEAVANIARKSSWEDIVPFVRVTVVKFASLFIIYSAFVWVLLANR